MNLKEIMEAGGPAIPTGTNYGMTLRDWFAGQVLAGIIAHSGEIISFQRIAEYAYKQADAMISVRRD